MYYTNEEPVYLATPILTVISYNSVTKLQGS